VKSHVIERDGASRVLSLFGGQCTTSSTTLEANEGAVNV
jgi:hypothetical protein